MEIGFKHHSSESPQGRAAAFYRLALAAAALAGCVWGPACSERAETYYEEARRHESNYDYGKAARRYELVASAFKRSPLREEAARGLDRCRAETHFDRAERFIYAGATYTALPEITAGRRLAPDNPRGFYLVGLAHLNIGPRDLSLREFEDCITRYPDSAYGYLGRAEYYRFRIKREEALADFVRAFRVARHDARARGAAFRGIRDMANKLGQPAEATKYYGREGKGATTEEAFNYWIGYYYLRKKPLIYRLAFHYFNEVIDGKGGGIYETRALARRAECYLFYKEYERAQADIDAALARDPENDAYYKIAEKIYGQLSLAPPRKTQK